VTGRIEVLPLAVAGEIAAGTDLVELVLAAAPPLRDGDVVVVAHKAVSKSEGRVVDLATVNPSGQAIELSREGGDPRMAELVLRESRRIVRRRAGLLIAETHHGFVCASAGIDRSNGPAAGWVVLLPVDPDLSAARLRAGLERRSGARLAVVVADTMGRALRRGMWAPPSGRAASTRSAATPGRSTRPATSCGRRPSPWPTSWPRPPISSSASSSASRRRSSAASRRAARAAAAT
jgi:coenzyme F420-0:L-glutamate ligase/coenzyme F420-1:gamma-L-glutamate ligase